MLNRTTSRHALTVALLLAVLALPGCLSKDGAIEPDPAFTPYISAFTAGHISARAPILVRIAEGQRWQDSTASAIQELFKFQPDVAGSVSWQDESTLAFTPSERLDQDQTYTIRFALGDLIEVPKGLEEFAFQVTTFRQGLDVSVSEMQCLSPTDMTWQRLIVTVYTSDDATGQDLESCLAASQEGRSLGITWEHEPNGRHHRFVADSVLRGEMASTVEISWDGKAIGTEDKGSLVFAIPAIGDLALVSTSTTSDGEQLAILQFSDPLDPEQDMTGLAGIAGAEDLRVAIEGNRLLLYPNERLSGDQQGYVSSALRNVNGHRLGKDLTIDLTFEDLKPAIRLIGKGTILPSSDGLVLPFEAVNLNAVEVRVIRIHESNIAQFLQVNALDGERELARVGRLVARKTISLRTQDAPDLGRWNRYHLDLAQHFKAEPGAIYRVQLSFDREHSAYPCEGAAPTDPAHERSWEDEQADYDQVEDYWYYDDYGYWDEEDRDSGDPCSAAYFVQNRSVSRNLLASDLGLIAKAGNDGSLFMAVSDLCTTAPLSGVKLELLDVQGKSMVSVVTDGQGLATSPRTQHKPFLLVASKGVQRGYLKLDDGASLSVSEFDAAGETIERGLKGFIYAERGVWRPGDSLYLTFLLQDALHRLPKDHPVVLELTDPRGRLDQKHVRTSGVQGMYSFRIATRHDAPTGIWSAEVLVGGTAFHKNLRIETVKPNRLKVLLDLDQERLTAGHVEPIKLRSLWLHGSPAKDLKARVTMTATKGSAKFKGLERFVFDDLRNQVPDEEQVLFDGRLNALGEASFPAHMEVGKNAPAVINANIVTRVFEAGGDASLDRITVPYYPYVSYVGIKAPDVRSAWGNLVTDTTYRFDVAAVNADGKSLAGQKLMAQVYRMDWNWWWDGSMTGPSNYISSPSAALRQEMPLTTDAKGRTSFKFRIDRPEWGRFVVRISDPASGHAAAVQVYVDWPGWEGRSRREAPEQAAMLRFNSDKERYNVGDQATLTIPSAGQGRALVSLETGSRVLEAVWVELQDKETKYQFPVTADMVPNVYAHVTVVQPHALTLNDLPIRLYGVIPLHVEDPSTRLAPVIGAPKEIRTGVPFALEVSEKNGNRMSYTLAIVDEGLLDLTRFKTPDPWKHFHAREALGVRTWDVYDQVIGSFGRQIQRLLALGGSDETNPDAAKRADRFKPVVRHIGPFTLEPGRKAKHEFTIGNYVGSVRVMVVATDDHHAYGNAEKAIPVRKPLMVLASMPRVLSPGELVDLPVTVFAMDAKVKDVVVSLEPNALLVPEGPSKKTVRFTSVGDKVVTFKVRVKDAVGVARMSVTAQGAGETANERIELDVRQPNLPTTDVLEAIVEPGSNWQQAISPVGVSGTNSSYVEVSSIPPVDMGRRLQYLIGYPHGCLEQTTSKAFPQLFIASVMELPDRYANELRANVEAAIRKISTFQRSDGAFNYWSGGDHYDTWTSIYAGHFLVEAGKQGYAVPPTMRANWLGHQRKMAREWNGAVAEGWVSSSTQLVQAYRLYVLALAGSQEIGAMNRLREQQSLGLTARWMLASAYAQIGRTDVSKILIKEQPLSVPAYTEQGNTYGSDLRDEAIVAEALLAMGETAKAAGVIQRISKLLSSDDWYSTQSTAFGLMAVARMAQRNELGKGMSYSVQRAGKTVAYKSSKAIARKDLDKPDQNSTIAITNTGKSLLYVRLVRRGTPVAGEERPGSNRLAMSVEYQLMDGSTLDPKRIEQGTDFRAVVRVTHPGAGGNYQQLALTQVFPSGWEIRNMRMEGSEAAMRMDPYTYRDQRDDRVMTYFDLRQGKSLTYTVLLNASYTGRFYLAGAHVEAMYDNTVNARSAGTWVEVVPPGGDQHAQK